PRRPRGHGGRRPEPAKPGPGRLTSDHPPRSQALHSLPRKGGPSTFFPAKRGHPLPPPQSGGGPGWGQARCRILPPSHAAQGQGSHVADADSGQAADNQAVEEFIARWRGVAASELSTSQSFLIDLCHLLGVDAPHPTPEQEYMFERPITFTHGAGSTSTGRIDLYG